MSRPTKFRAWHKKAKEYRVIEQLSFDRSNRADCITTVDYATWHDSWDDVIEEVEIEQYTGLKDKNGKDIYEGDIFRNAINGGTWYVYWNEKDAAFWVDSGVAGCSLGEFDWDRSNRKYGFIGKNCEVIGNVHKPPKDFRPEHLKRMGVSISKGGEE